LNSSRNGESESANDIVFSGVVKPLKFACAFFRIFRELNKTAKLEGTNIDTITTLNDTVCCVGIVWFEFAETEGAKIIISREVANF